MKLPWILLFLFLLLYFVDLSTDHRVSSFVEDKLLFISTPFFYTRSFFSEKARCFTEKEDYGDIILNGEKIGGNSPVTGYYDGVLFVLGNFPKGCLVFSPGKGFIGVVESSSGGISTVITPFSKKFLMKVFVVKDGFKTVGIMKGGSPPILRIFENLDVVGGKVFVGETTWNLILKRLKGDYIGEVVGVSKEDFLVKVSRNIPEYVSILEVR
ncbi:MAG: hypothetical protein B5M49_01640 [Thermotoga sp. 4484_232]|nr:MAG: hypothetical protein B5M49_01640 [Thermotoga sp. 4484_232]